MTTTIAATDPWPTINRLVTWLDQNNGRDQHEVTLRIFKLVEEVGEVAQARIGILGQNPRKGVTHTEQDLADELCDVIVTAMVALASTTDDPAGHFATKLAQIARKRGATTTPKPGDYCDCANHPGTCDGKGWCSTASPQATHDSPIGGAA